MHDKRKDTRKSIRYPALIDIGDGSPALPCKFSNVSESGAQVEVAASTPALPEEFTLVLGYDGSARRRCRAVWRSDTLIGLEFLKGQP
jgi:hypothetical protein